jgi:hypothetical protein
MPTKETIAGLLVLAVLGAGVYWVRVRPARTAAEATAPAASSGETSPPDVTMTTASVEIGDTRITMELEPKPPVAYAPMHVRVRTERHGQAVVPGDAKVSFEMVMPMGDHRYAFVAGADGWLDADVTLPLCPFGDRRWFATVEWTADGQLQAARFRLDLWPPGLKQAPPRD